MRGEHFQAEIEQRLLDEANQKLVLRKISRWMLSDDCWRCTIKSSTQPTWSQLQDPLD